MKITQDIGIRICGTGSSVPERKISNDDMATIVETNDEWIRTRTGISNEVLRSQDYYKARFGLRHLSAH